MEKVKKSVNPVGESLGDLVSRLATMSYQELETERKYVVGAADRVRAKLGISRSEVDSMDAIKSRMIFEFGNPRVAISGDIFNPQPKDGKQ